MHRIVEDSDDEGQSPPQRKRIGLATEVPLDLPDTANGSPENMAQANTHSTSSTELLRREIQKAHNALVEPTPTNRHTVREESKSTAVSPSVRPPKRSRTATGPASYQNQDNIKAPKGNVSVNVVRRSTHHTSGHSNGSDITGSQTTKVGEQHASRGQGAVVDEWEVPRSSGPDDDSRILTKVESRNAVRQHIVVTAEAISENDSKFSTGQMVQDVQSSPVRKRIRRRITVHQPLDDRNRENACNSWSLTTPGHQSSPVGGVLGQIERARTTPSDPMLQRPTDLSVGISPEATQLFIASGLQADFVAHQPFSMFPDDSSTIPDNTASQQQKLQMALAQSEGLVLEQMRTSAILPEKGSSSISSSAFVNTQSRHTDSPTTSLSKRAGTAEGGDQMGTLEPLANVDPATQTSARTRAAETQTHVEVDSADHELFVDELSLNANIQSTQARTETVPSHSGSTLKQAETKEPPESKKRKATTSKAAPELDSDEIVIGLPKEQYKPRPTRSRSTRTTVNDVPDLSVRPEKAARAKRRKTDGAATQAPQQTELEKVDIITLMGFRSSQAARALEESHGQVEGAIEQLLDGAEPESDPKEFDTTRPEDSPSRLHFSEVKQPAITRQHSPSEQMEPHANNKTAGSCNIDYNPASTDPNRLEGTLPATKEDQIPETETGAEKHLPDPAASTQIHSKPKRRKSTRTGAEQEATEAVTATQAEPAGQTKRGRGRPRKPTQVQEEPPMSLAADASAPVEKPQRNDNDQDALQEMDSNQPQNRVAGEKKAPPPATPPEDTKAPFSRDETGKQDENALRTPQKGGASTAKGPASHSPIDKGKVPIRVGLSKRARIAPLLRVVKK